MAHNAATYHIVEIDAGDKVTILSKGLSRKAAQETLGRLRDEYGKHGLRYVMYHDKADAHQGDRRELWPNANVGGELMTAREANRLIKQTLVELNIPHTKVSAQTVGFSDLGRGERVFVTVHGWERGYEAPSRYALLADVAKKNGFSVDVRVGQ